MNNRTRDAALYDVLIQDLQKEAGSSFQIQAILGLSPVMTEVKVVDKASGRAFAARLYRVSESQRELVHQTWRLCFPDDNQPPRKLPQATYGLKTMGTLTAHVGAHLPGIDLATYLTIIGTSQPAYAVRTGVALLRILDALAQMDISHYALRPEDIVINRDGRILLKNAGLAIFETMLARKLGVSNLQDPLYAAPEQILGQSAASTVDIYRTGLILFEMAAGRPPFVGDATSVAKAHCETPVPNPQTFNPDVDLGLIRVIAKALAKKPEQRFSSFAEMRQALEMLLPPLERFALSGTPSQQSSDPKEESRIKAQIKEAHGFAQNREFAAALRALDTLMTTTGPREDALSLYRKAWQAHYGQTIKTYLDKASQLADQKQDGEALKQLHQLFSLQPLHPGAKALQTTLLDRLPETPPAGRAIVNIKAYQDVALKAQQEGNSLMERGLITDIATLTEKEMNPGDIVAITAAREMLTGSPVAPQLGAPQLGAPPPPMEPEDDLVDFDDLDLDHLDDSPAPPAPATEPMPPPAPTAVPPTGADEDPFAFDENEDLLGIPPEAVPPPPAKPKKKLPLIPILAGAAAVLAVIVVLVVMQVVQGRKRDAAMAAYTAAEQLENSGEWDRALQEWALVGEAYPNMKFPDGSVEERYKTLEYKILNRERTIRDNLAQATQLLMDTETPVHQMAENPVTYLRNVLQVEQDNAEATGLMETIRDRELSRAQLLLEAGKVMEAKEVHDFLVAIDPAYRDPDLSLEIDAWVEKNVIGPQLAKLDNAIRRKQWEKAQEIGAELQETMDDPRYVQERWDKVFAEYDNNYRDAQTQGNQAKMLAALEVMTQIRPDDQSLIDEKDKLNRSLNLSRILDLEKKINNALNRKELITAVSNAVRLRRLESENQIAKDAIGLFRRTYEDRIEQQKQNNPRAALASYDTLIKQLNWRMHRQARSELQSRIQKFDQTTSQLFKQRVDQFDNYKAALDSAISSFAEFSQDQAYSRMMQTRESLVSENQRLGDIVRWEEQVRNDVGTPYQQIINRLQEMKSFRFQFAKNQMAQLIDTYKGKIENYSDTVTLVVKGARDLPGNRRNRTYCILETGGETFKTEIANGKSPNWSFTSTFKAKAGTPLVFKVYNKRGDKLIGQVSLPKVPMDTKDLALKPESGGWTLFVDVKRER